MESQENNTRKVKGIWIPIEIWENKDLSWNEKILFLEIDSFTSNDKDCYVSNEYIAKLLGVCETSANKVLSSLINKGYVVKTSFDGRRRFVKSALHLTTSQGCSEQQGCIALKSNIPNIDNNTSTDNKKENNKLFSEKAELTWREDFSVYVKLVLDAKDALLKDVAFKAKQEEYYPNLNYDLSLQKMVDDYWGTEEAWNKRKRQKKGDQGINMVTTLKKAFNQSCNRVYKHRGANKPQADLFSGYTEHKISGRAKSYLSELKVEIKAERDGVKYLADDTFIENGKRFYRNKRGQFVEVPIGLVARPNENWEYDKRSMVWVQDIQTETMNDFML